MNKVLIFSNDEELLIAILDMNKDIVHLIQHGDNVSISTLQLEPIEKEKYSCLYKYDDMFIVCGYVDCKLWLAVGDDLYYEVDNIKIVSNTGSTEELEVLKKTYKDIKFIMI